MWGVWGEHGCVGVPGCAGGFVGVHRCAPVCIVVGVGRRGGCVGVHGHMHVYGMNFQNFFWRIESLHQRTLIRILYKFLIVQIT